MSWASLANNQTISFTNLKDAVDTGVLSPKTSIPVSNEQITKAETNTYVWIDTLFGPYASKASNQLVVKSNLSCGTPVVNTTNLIWSGIANNETTSSPIQLLAGRSNLGGGRISRSTDYGLNYSNVLAIDDALIDIKYAPNFRHASYLSVTPFIAVGNNGRIVTNSVNAATSWITISSPTTQGLSASSFNLIGRGVIVGNQRILVTNTDYRINSWSITNGVNANWRAVANDGFNFVAVGTNGAIATSDSALGVNWTIRSMPPLSISGINLFGVTYHTDGFFYAVGNTPSNTYYIMRSSNSGAGWTQYIPTDFTLFAGELYSIASIGGRLVIGGLNYQYQIRDNVVTRCGANADAVSMGWNAIVKDAATSNGFDMAGSGLIGSNIGAYSNF
jgi:hypothetical protein